MPKINRAYYALTDALGLTTPTEHYPDGADLDAFEMWKMPWVPSSVILNPKHQLLGALRPFIKLGKDFSETFTPYYSSGKRKRDWMQPIDGVINLCLGVFNVICAAILLIGWLPSILLIRVVPIYFLRGIYPLSWLIEGVGKITQGLAQLITTPLTYLFKIPFRQYLTKNSPTAFAEHKPEINRLVNSANDIIHKLNESYSEIPSHGLSLSQIKCGLVWLDEKPHENELKRLQTACFIRTSDNLYYYCFKRRIFESERYDAQSGRYIRPYREIRDLIPITNEENPDEQFLSRFDSYLPKQEYSIEQLSVGQLALISTLTNETKFSRSNYESNEINCRYYWEHDDSKLHNEKINYRRNDFRLKIIEIHRKHQKSIQDGWGSQAPQPHLEKAERDYQNVIQFFSTIDKKNKHETQLPIEERVVTAAQEYLDVFKIP